MFLIFKDFFLVIQTEQNMCYMYIHSCEMNIGDLINWLRREQGKILFATDRETEGLWTCIHHLVHAHRNVTWPDTPEIVSVIDSPKVNKVPGPNNIYPELLKAERVHSYYNFSSNVFLSWSFTTQTQRGYHYIITIQGQPNWIGGKSHFWTCLIRELFI